MRAYLAVLLALVACSSDDSNWYCGDGLVEADEQCDDGNSTSGDGCSSLCQREALTCGDGRVDAPETCDDGNTLSYDGCSANCAIELCGNGVIDAGEQCDDGNHKPADGCSQTCKAETSHTLTASWRLTTLAGTRQPCPSGYDTVAVRSQPIDLNGNPSGTPFVDLFNCAASMGSTAPLYEGTYEVSIAVTNTSGSLTYATSVPAR